MAELRVGLCGCGNMGSAIAERLHGRVALTVFDLDRDRATSTGAHVADDLVHLAAAADIVVLSLPAPAISAAAIGELLPALARGAAIVETSTVGPSDLAEAAGRVTVHGVALVDAAIMSGPAQMRAGATTLLVGGSDADVVRVEPLLDLLGGTRHRLGELGAGMAAKVAHNAISHAVMVVLVEALSMVASAGVDPALFAEILASPDAALLRPLTHRVQERIFSGDYEGGMPTDAALKDSLLALELAEQHGVPLFAIQAAHTPYAVAVAEGLGRKDYAVLAELWERWTGRSLR